MSTYYSLCLILLCIPCGVAEEILQARFDSAWNKEVSVQLVASSRGKFRPSKECPTPRLLVHLCGHMRGMEFSRASLLEALRRSTDCFFVSVVTPSTLHWDTCHNCSAWEHSNMRKKHHRPELMMNSSRGFKSVPALLAEIEADFNGRLAYAVVNRHGALEHYGPCFSFYWAAVHMVAEWALDVAIDPTALVMRTRPNAVWNHYFRNIEAFRAYLQSDTLRARHLIIGQENASPRRQSDYMLLTSARVYASDIAVPLQHGIYSSSNISHEFRELFEQMGTMNGWGYGLSMGIGAYRLATNDTVCACVSGGVTCDSTSCFSFIVQAPSAMYLLQEWSEYHPGPLSFAPVDLTEFRAYCPDPSNLTLIRANTFKLRYIKPGSVHVRIQSTRLIEGLNVAINATIFESRLFPPGCGPVSYYGPGNPYLASHSGHPPVRVMNEMIRQQLRTAGFAWLLL